MAQANAPLGPGDKVPALTLDGTGGTVALAELSRALLIFYPKDATSGCTSELQDFSARAEAFAAAGYRIFGISPDGIESHRRFIQKAGLALPLLADEGAAAARAFGVWGEKTTFGKSYMGLIRSTFAIEAPGTISAHWTVARVKGHAEAVLSALTKG
ncbi:peroxiredoxin [Pseudoroseicyclus sp. CXY001]|uniref:peroxiredoxin n=1 Tax=Pseudoroseicyclus sp. CXY001 TaxID=3242492 RepID=UPI00358DB583